jgi:uncharacterized small protein (DUF1192 family)
LQRVAANDMTWELIAKQLQERTGSPIVRTATDCRQQWHQLRTSYYRFKLQQDEATVPGTEQDTHDVDSSGGHADDDTLFSVIDNLDTLMREWGRDTGSQLLSGMTLPQARGVTTGHAHGHTQTMSHPDPSLSSHYSLVSHPILSHAQSPQPSSASPTQHSYLPHGAVQSELPMLQSFATSSHTTTIHRLPTQPVILGLPLGMSSHHHDIIATPSPVLGMGSQQSHHMTHGIATTKMADTKPDQADSVLHLAQSIEHHQQHQFQYFQDVLDNTAKLLEEHKFHADAVRQDHQRTITTALTKILRRIEALEDNIARVKANMNAKRKQSSSAFATPAYPEAQTNTAEANKAAEEGSQ